MVKVVDVPVLAEKLGFFVTKEGKSDKSKNRELIAHLMLTTGIVPASEEDLDKLLNSDTQFLRDVVDATRVYFGVPSQINTLFGDNFWEEYDRHGECFLRLLTVAHYASVYGTLLLTGETSSENNWVPPFERKENNISLRTDRIKKVKVLYENESEEIVFKALYESTVQDLQIADFVERAILALKPAFPKDKFVKNRFLLSKILGSLISAYKEGVITSMPKITTRVVVDSIKAAKRSYEYGRTFEEHLANLLHFLDEEDFYREYRKDDRKGRRHLRGLFASLGGTNRHHLVPDKFKQFLNREYREKFYAEDLGRDKQAKMAYIAKRDKDVLSWKKLFQENPVYAITNAVPALFNQVLEDKEEFLNYFERFVETDLLQAVRFFNAFAYRVSLGEAALNGREEDIPNKHFVRVEGVWHEAKGMKVPSPLAQYEYRTVYREMEKLLARSVYEKIKGSLKEHVVGDCENCFADLYEKNHYVIPTFRAFNFPAFDVGSSFKLDSSKSYDMFGVFWVHEKDECVDLDVHYHLLDENFKVMAKISWNGDYQYPGLRFSGDMTCGVSLDGGIPTAAELVAIDPEILLWKGVRFVVSEFHEYRAWSSYAFGSAFTSVDKRPVWKNNTGEGLDSTQRYVTGSSNKRFRVFMPVFVYDVANREVIVTPAVVGRWSSVFTRSAGEVSELSKETILFANHKAMSFSLKSFISWNEDSELKSVHPEKLAEIVAKLLIP